MDRLCDYQLCTQRAETNSSSCYYHTKLQRRLLQASPANVERERLQRKAEKTIQRALKEAR